MVLSLYFSALVTIHAVLNRLVKKNMNFIAIDLVYHEIVIIVHKLNNSLPIAHNLSKTSMNKGSTFILFLVLTS